MINLRCYSSRYGNCPGYNSRSGRLTALWRYRCEARYKRKSYTKLWFIFKRVCKIWSIITSPVVSFMVVPATCIATIHDRRTLRQDYPRLCSSSSLPRTQLYLFSFPALRIMLLSSTRGKRQLDEHLSIYLPESVLRSYTDSLEGVLTRMITMSNRVLIRSSPHQ